MRTFSIAVLTIFGLALGATLINRPAASALAPADESHQTSVAIDQLPVNIKQLPAQAFDAF